MGPFEIVTLVAVGVAVAGVVIYLIRKKIAGGGGCDCGGCSSCPHCSACRPKGEGKPAGPAARKGEGPERE